MTSCEEMFVLSARQNIEQRGSSQMPISEKDQFFGPVADNAGMDDGISRPLRESGAGTIECELLDFTGMFVRVVSGDFGFGTTKVTLLAAPS